MMLRVSLIIVILLHGFGALSQGQTLAKVKYEQAEMEYSKNNFGEALNLLAETEKILKSSNTRIQYLKILCLDKKLEWDTTATFLDLTTLKKNCDLYLKAVDVKPEYEDRFKEVYLITEKIKKYPQTEVAFKTHLVEIRKKYSEEEERKKQKLLEAQLYAKLVQYKNNIDGIQIGMSLSSVPSSAWVYLSREGYSYEKDAFGNKKPCVIYIPHYRSLKIKPSVGLSGLSVYSDNQKVFSVVKNLEVGSLSKKQQYSAIFDAKLLELQSIFGADNIVVTETEVPLENNHTSYNKSLTIKGELPVNYMFSYYYLDIGVGSQCVVSETLYEM
jgi:hypothetical protein